MSEGFSPIPRPILAYRVGVTGARDLSAAPLGRLREKIADLFRLIEDELDRLAGETAPYYASCESGRKFALRLVSPLAAGADRLAAEEALKCGARLYAPLPFPQNEYEKDFPESVEDFRRLSQNADILELDGAHGAAAEESYLEVGRFVARNCDLLIALWDGEPGRGRGGTADIVHFAARFGPPIWLIDLFDRRAPQFIARPAHLRARDEAPSGAGAEAALKDYLRRTVAPPLPPAPRKDGLFCSIAHILRRFTDDDAAPLRDFYAEKVPRSCRLWGVFDGLTRLLAGRAALSAAPPDPLPPAPVENWWRRFYRPADMVSVAYRDRYRSSYVWIAFCAVIALTLAGFAGEVSQALRKVFVGFEFLAFVAIGALIVANHRHRWHERWISYRLLAELCRKQSMLANLGRALPNVDVASLAAESSESDDPRRPPREAWVAWYFAAAMRGAPPLVGSFATLKPHALACARALIAAQRDYHEQRGDRNRRTDRGLERLGELFFVLSLLIVVGQLAIVGLDLKPEAYRIGLLSAAVGAVASTSAAFVAIRAYAEFPLVARQSAHMLRILDQAEERLDDFVVAEPLAGRELGRVLVALAMAMMQDVAGWAQLFRLKIVGAG
ncbi:hypothetical protein [Rhodoblastus sp.]|uniref:hypothetical protein n=1 Tax=Rhodoblastus sp. TaxID=1962975 RepID=UPI003F990F62